MRKILITSVLTLAVLALTSLALPPLTTADAGHDKKYTFGEPGKTADVTQTIQVDAVDANGEMRFEHAPLTIKQGETIKFVVTNKGEIAHEFSIGDAASQRAHAAMMQKMPDMKHENDATAVTLQPGQTKELVWTFSKPVKGQIELACQVPGHYEGGMVSKLPLSK